MATITPPRSQHNLKASTLPQTARPPTRKPRGLKAFWRRLSQSPRPDEKEKRPTKNEKIRSTVSAQSLEAVLCSPRGRGDGSKSPSVRRASGHTPEKRKSSFGTFFSSAFSHGKHEKDGRQHKKHSKSRTAASSAEEVVNGATTPGSQGNGQLGKFDYKYEDVPATTVPSLSPQDIKSITSSPRVLSRATTSVTTSGRPRSSPSVAAAQQSARSDSPKLLDLSQPAASHLVSVTSTIKQLGPAHATTHHLSSEGGTTTNGRPASLNLPSLESNVLHSSSQPAIVTTAPVGGGKKMPGVVPGYREAAMGQGDDAGISHRMQSSIDTIGTCSLDVQAATSPSAPPELVNGSEHTLRSVSLAHPITQVPASGRCSLLSPEVRSPPSYLGIACAVSGYSSLNRYDSAVREGFRSRDSSPAPPRLAFTRSRDSSPLRERLRSPENRCTPQETAARISTLKAQLARCANELDSRSRQGSVRRRDKKPPSGRSISVDRGYLTKASLIHTGASQGYGQHNASLPTGDTDQYSAHRDNRSPHSSGYREGAASPRYQSGSSPRHSGYSGGSESARRGYFGSTSNMTSHQIPVRLLDPQQTFNGHIGSPLTTLHSRPTIDTTIEDTRSFIQERIERLYGPGALAAGFIRRSPAAADGGGMGNTVRRASNRRAEEGRVIPIQLEYTPDDQDKRNEEVEGSKGLPSVFRHLRPEFRHQLPLKSPSSGTAKSIAVKRSDSSDGESPLSPATNGHAGSVTTFEGSPQSRPAASIVPPPLEAPSSPPTVPASVSNGSLSNGSHPQPIPASQTKDSDSVSVISGSVVQQSPSIVSRSLAVDEVDAAAASVASTVVQQPSCTGVSRKSEDSSSPQNGCCASLLGGNKVAPTTTATEVCPPLAAAPTAATSADADEVKDGHYFLKIVAAEVTQLEREVAEIERDSEPHAASMTEEVRGKLFAGTGKTKLLISQKIKQFSGLCHKNIAGQQGTDEFPTTCSDLAGFWDMVSLQVEDVHKLLSDLRAIRDNGWKELAPVDTPDSGKPRATAPTSSRARRTKPAPTAAEKAKDEARKKAAEERRKAMRETMKAKRAAAAAEAATGGQEDADIFVPEN